jgi:hypothetical protein
MPHEPTPETLEISLPFGTWLTVEAVLREQRYSMQRWLANKTEASEQSRNVKERDIEDITRAIDTIIDRTSSVG